MKINLFIRRFMVPSIFKSIYYYMKYSCMVSPKAEVDLSFLIQIGKLSTIASFTKIKASKGKLVIGKNVMIGESCHIGAGPKGVVIGDDCIIGPHVSIIGANYKYEHLDIPVRLQGSSNKGTQIGNNVWIGTGCCILDGAIIGNNVIVTPNSVVSTRIPDNYIVQGNPAKKIFMRR